MDTAFGGAEGARRARGTMGRMSRLAAGLHAALALLLLAACTTRVDVPENVVVSGGQPARLRSGPALDFAASPTIEQIWLSSLVLTRGSTWAGEISTSSNAASVEVRTDSFSFSVPRVRDGLFAFSYAIPDLPAYLRRRFVLHVVARNAAGDRNDEPIPIEIQ
jgi:hypothetical protein